MYGTAEGDWQEVSEYLLSHILNTNSISIRNSVVSSLDAAIIVRELQIHENGDEESSEFEKKSIKGNAFSKYEFVESKL